MRDQIQASLDDAHKKFFECIDVDPVSGVVKGPHLKFPAYPYIGSHYGELRRIMIVGMDIGWIDPKQEVIQSFEDRRVRIEDDKPLNELNPHMSGTCVTAMHFLKDQCTEWQKWLEESDKDRVPQALLNNVKRLPSRNPLSYIAFTNYHKFLLAGNGEKVQLDRTVEEDFLMKEAETLRAEIIVMQSASFRHSYHKKLLDRLSKIARVHISNHPSVRGERRYLGNLLQSIQPWPQ